MRDLIDARRRGEDDVLDRVADILIMKSKTVIYKYAAVLKPYGYHYKNLYSLWRHYVAEFLDEVEFPIDDIFSYFNGYVSHRFYRIVELEGRNKRVSNCYAESLEEVIYDFGSSCVRLGDCLPSDENIQTWCSATELIDRYIKDLDSDFLSSNEKEILDQKLEGSTFKEISESYGLSYKQVVYIYNKGIEKLRSLVNIFPKSLQNSTIF